MQRIRLLQPEHFLNYLIQTLSFKDRANLADILRMMDSEQEATKTLFLAPIKQVLPKETPFKNLFLHDGSSLTLNPRLKEELPGRFN